MLGDRLAVADDPLHKPRLLAPQPEGGMTARHARWQL